MDNRPVGMFDSGLGGLTAYSRLRELMPNENIIYFADSGRNPYGVRPQEQLRRIAKQDLDFLASFDVKAVIAACGTIYVNAVDVMKAYPISVTNVAEPGVAAMCAVEGNGPLAVIATDASTKSGVYQKLLAEAAPEREAMVIGCQDFVKLCETGHTAPEDELLQEAVERYLAPIKEAGADAILLGCTHFGLIGKAIANYLGPKTKVISAAGSAAELLAEKLKAEGLEGTEGTARFFTSGDTAEFDAFAGSILGTAVQSEHIPPMEV